MINKARPTKILGDESGFTIVELIIATSIFAVVLLTITLGVVSFSKSYSNAVISSSTQNTVQNVTNTVEKVVRLSDGTITLHAPTQSTAGVLCIGNVQFNYWLGYEQPQQITPYSSADPYALYEELLPGGACSSSATYASNGQSLLADNERLLAFNVVPVGGTTDLFSINVIVAFTSGGTNGNGNSLLCASNIYPNTLAGGCSESAANISYSQLVSNSSNIVCVPGVQQQFCDVSGLQTNVESRL